MPGVGKITFERCLFFDDPTTIQNKNMGYAGECFRLVVGYVY